MTQSCSTDKLISILRAFAALALEIVLPLKPLTPLRGGEYFGEVRYASIFPGYLALTRQRAHFHACTDEGHIAVGRTGVVKVREAERQGGAYGVAHPVRQLCRVDQQPENTAFEKIVRKNFEEDQHLQKLTQRSAWLYLSPTQAETTGR